MRFPFIGGSSLLCEIVKQLLALPHQQMTPPPAPVAINPYHEGSLIFVMTTPPESSSKLAPRLKGPFFVKRVPNAYQVTYEDDLVWRTVHVNHVKPAKSLLMDSLFLCLHLNHPCLLQDISRGVSSGLNPATNSSSTSRPCRRANPASCRAMRRHASPESAHHTLIIQSEFSFPL